MRRIRAPVEAKVAEKKPAISMEPMGESIQKKPHPRGFYFNMSDDEFVAHVQRFMRDRRITTIMELVKADKGLHSALYRKNARSPGIIERIRFRAARRGWAAKSDDDFVEHAKRIMAEKGLSGRSELKKADGGFFNALHEREGTSPGIMDRVGFVEKLRHWDAMDDDELIALAQTLMKKYGVNSRSGLEHADSGLYAELMRRDKEKSGFMAKVGFIDKRRKERKWGAMGDEELIRHARSFMDEAGITSKWELGKADVGLYNTLTKRNRKHPGIMERIGFVDKKPKSRDWDSLSDDELAGHARKFMDERGLQGRAELGAADVGLYVALLRREKMSPGVMKKVGFVETFRNWKSMPDDDLVRHAQRIVAEKGICERKGLRMLDLGLFSILYRRNLLHRVFAPVEGESKKQALRAIKKATEGFG
jgi:hypothetical protein